MRIEIASTKAIRFACVKYHYSGIAPLSGNHIGYSVFNDASEWCGVILFGSGANNMAGKEFGLVAGQYLELTRVALNGRQGEGMTSKAVSLCLKRVKKDCPTLRLIISYADIDQNHYGTIYQATNWIYVGEKLKNSKDGAWIVKGKKVHGRAISLKIARMGGSKGLSRAQFVRRYYDKDAVEYVTKGKRKYLYPLDKQMREKIKPMAKPYPKDANRKSFKDAHLGRFAKSCEDGKGNIDLNC